MKFLFATAIFAILMSLFMGITLLVVFYNTSMHLEQAMITDSAREINTRTTNQSPRIADASSNTWDQPTTDEERTERRNKIHGWVTHVQPSL